jgi:cytosolic phospholipase A2
MKQRQLIIAIILLLTFNIYRSTAHPPMPIYDYSSDELAAYRDISLGQMFSEITTSLKDIVAKIPATIQSWFSNITSEDEPPVQVRVTQQDTLCSDEQHFIAERQKTVRIAISNLLQTPDQSLKKVPTIAVCCSGGGFRAMILTLGFLQGLQETGILDTVTYLCTLSGSTWFVAPWLATDRSLHEYQPMLAESIAHGLRPIRQFQHLEQIARQFFYRLLKQQPLSSIDIYGTLLANTLLAPLGSQNLSISLSKAHQYLDPARHPFPIYTAITPNVSPYEWFEITPFELGSTYLHAYIPTWAYGRAFYNGSSLNHVPEQSLGYFMGIFGSAFSVNVRELVHATAQGLKDAIPPCIRTSLSECLNLILGPSWKESRLIPSLLPNFAYQLPAVPLNNHPHLVLIDAGIDFNVPLPPLLRSDRKVDLILIYDASGEVDYARELRQACAYARRYNIRFSPLANDIGQKPVTLIAPLHQETPLLLYFPRIKNPAYSPVFDPDWCVSSDYCHTFNFCYTPVQLEELCGLARFTVHQHAPLIKQIIAQLLA